MVFQLFFYLSLLLLLLFSLITIAKKYKLIYIYLLFQFSLVAMINLDGIRLGGELFKSLDILVTAILTIIFLITIIYMKTRVISNFILYSIYLLNALVSTVLSPVALESAKFLSRQFFFLLLMIIVMNYKMDKEKINKLLTLWYKFTLFPAIYSIIQVATGTGYRIKEDIGISFLTRGYALTSHPNFLAYYLMMTLLIFLIVYNSDDFKIKKRSVAIIAIIDVVALLLTFCRGALIGLTVGFILLYWKKDRIKLLFIPLLFGGTVFIPGVGYKIMEMFTLNKLLTDSSFSWRIQNWINILQLLNYKNIFIGNSLKSAIYYVNYPPHNEYVGFLFENGIIGFLAFYSFLVSLFILYRKHYKKADAEYKNYFLAGQILTIVSLIVSISDNYFLVPSSIYYFWFFNGLLLNIILNNKKEIISTNNVEKRAL